MLKVYPIQDYQQCSLLYTFQQHTFTPTTITTVRPQPFVVQTIKWMSHDLSVASQCHMDIDKIPNYVF